MMVKKESFKKLCDFYEKRRRVDGDGTVADPFAAQLEREAMAALEPNNDDAVHKSVVNAQIVALSTESGPVEPKKVDANPVDVNEFYETLSAKNCPALAGKPKIDASAPDEHHSTPTARGTWRHNTRRATSHQQQAQNAATATEPNSNSSGGTIDVAMMELDGAGAAQRQQSGQSADFPRVSLPLDDSLDEALLPLGLTVQHALKFQMDYEAHNREVLECLRNFRLESVENVWARFWAGASESDHAEGAVGEEELLLGDHQMQLSRYRLCTVPQLLGLVQHVWTCASPTSYCLTSCCLTRFARPYQPMHTALPIGINFCCPKVRPFAKNLCACMAKALGDGAPSALRELKFAGVRLLSNAFTRLSSVAHLAITAREVLHSDEQMSQMHADFDRLDFSVLHEQAEWCCDWSLGWLRSLEQQFGARLAQRRRLEDWADWLDDLAARALQSLAPLTTTRSQKMPEAQLARGKRLLLAWTF